MSSYDLIVIGAGPGGYVAAIRGAQLGLKTAIVEKESKLGGTCLRVGCIPSKALLQSSERFHQAQHEAASHGIKLDGVSLDLETMMSRKDGIVDELTSGIDYLMKKNKIDRLEGLGTITGNNTVMVTPESGDVRTVSNYEAKHIVIATGSSSSTFPSMELDGDSIGDSTTALSYDSVPEHLVVIGAGVIGLELGSVWNRLGSEVTVLEYLNRILPGMDKEIAKVAQSTFKKQGMKFQLKSKVLSVTKKDDGCHVEVEGQDTIICDKVLVAVGRKPNTDGLGLETVGVTTDERGFVQIDGHFKTSVDGIYAIGDVVGGAMLAHKAEEEGIACVEHIVNGYGHVNYGAIPSVVYTEPEIASVGKTEEELKDAGIDYKKGSFPYQANGRAKAIGQVGGKVKILADAKTDRILGVHIIGSHAGDLVAEAAVAIEFGASAEDIARTSHAHPTLAEVVKEAALAVDGRAIHI